MILSQLDISATQKASFQYNKLNPHSTPENRGLSKTTAALYGKPCDASHHGRSGYYFQLFCSFNNRQFGGLYSRTEGNWILEHFKDYRGQISPREFGAAAERAIFAGRVA